MSCLLMTLYRWLDAILRSAFLLGRKIRIRDFPIDQGITNVPDAA